MPDFFHLAELSPSLIHAGTHAALDPFLQLNNIPL